MIGVSTLDDGVRGEIRAGVVVAADGLRSVIAKRLGLAQIGRASCRERVLACV